MFKKKIVLLFLLLCGCENKRTYACVKDIESNQIYLDIETINDTIISLNVTESFALPFNLLHHENRLNDFKKQLGEDYIIENNKLIHNYLIIPDDRYSISKTLVYLKKEKFICE